MLGYYDAFPGKGLFAGYSPIIKRIPSRIDRTKGITTYDIDNMYPQRMEELALRSPITLSAIDAMQRFMRGNGFMDNGDLVVNRYGQNLNDILREISKDNAYFNGWALLLNTNELGLVTEIFPVKFKTIRFSLPDKNGRFFTVKTSIAWDKLDYRLLKNIKEYPLWERRDFVDIGDIEDFRGYIHYVIPEQDRYPICSFDAVADSAQTNAEIQIFELGSIQNSFLGTSLFKYPGEIESPEERMRILNDLRQLTGARNAGSAYLLEVPDDFEGNIIENIPANNNDRLFELTNQNSVERIIARFGIPAPILGIQPQGGGIFNEDQIRDAYTYMNARTEDFRNDIVSGFNKVLKYWIDGEINLGQIEKITFDGTTTNTSE